MRGFGVFILISMLLGGTGALAVAGQSASDGEQVYTAQRCSLCHMVAGKGNKKGPLDDVGRRLSADEIREWIINPAEMTAKSKAPRKPPMKPYANLPKADLESLVAYLLTLQGS